MLRLYFQSNAMQCCKSDITVQPGMHKQCKRKTRIKGTGQKGF